LTFRRPSAKPSSDPRLGREALHRLVLWALAGAIVLAVAVWAFIEDKESVLLAAALIAPALAIVVYRRSLQASAEAHRLALTDQLTGLGNDRAFAERLESDLNDARRRGGLLTLCLLDIDDFKRVNDHFGHPVGDRVLAQVASCIRRDGEGFRLGGDEFALVLPGASEEEARTIAERVIDRVMETEYGHGGAVSASAGVATYPTHTVDRVELVHLADAALYWAKADGKKCVRAYSHELASPLEIGPVGAEGGRAAFLRATSALAKAATERGIVSPTRSSAVGNLAASVARRMGFSPEHVELIRVAGTLNDIGKLALPDDLLSKPGPLTAEERQTVERHAQIGYQILDSLGIDSIATWVLHHHERWDGDGYPERLAGERIPLGSRILFVADAYEAMTNDQAWRPGMSSGAALLELERCAGTQFDPLVVAAFVSELGTERVVVSSAS
jgi:two-component system cell cycle response regulator